MSYIPINTICKSIINKVLTYPNGYGSLYSDSKYWSVGTWNIK